MSDRVDARIKIGGEVPAAETQALIETILSEDLRPDWDAPFAGSADVLAHLNEGSAGVTLYGQEVRSGEFDRLQAFCTRVGLTYVLTYDGYGGEWGPGRRIRGPQDVGEGLTCPLSEDGGDACVTAAMIRRHRLDTRDAILAWLARFDAGETPPLVLQPPL